MELLGPISLPDCLELPQLSNLIERSKNKHLQYETNSGSALKDHYSLPLYFFNQEP